MPNGRDGQGTLQVLFDAETKLFQWRLAVVTLAAHEPRLPERVELPVPIEFTSGSRVAYAGKDVLVTFTIMPDPPTLYVQETRDHAETMSAATTASLNAAADTLSEYQRRSPYGTAILLHPRLGNDFFGPPGSAAVAVLGGAKITGVSRRNGQWELVVKGQWTEKIVLTDKFELVGMTRVD
jgi:hypothetical protein